MTISTDMIKELRAKTGAGVLDCKTALEKSKGDMEQALEILRQRGLAIAAQKVGRVAQEGLVEAYVHTGGRIASLVEVNCETDFVARTDEFRRLAHDLAMQVAAIAPKYLLPENVPATVVEEEKEKYRAQLAEEGKPDHVIEEIIEGKLEKFYEEVCLLKQPFIKDEGYTVQELILQKIAQLGENIQVRRFVRFELGVE